MKGLNKLQVNHDQLAKDLDNSWEVLAEPIQTVMRRYGIEEPYEKLKALTRGQVMNQALIQQFIESLEIPDEAKARLLAMVPGTYIGNADHQASKV
jgi:adenylosuccinate lyase